MFLSLALFLFLSLLSLSLTLSIYLSYRGGSVFIFCFVDFLVFFLLIFKWFCIVLTIGLFLTLVVLSSDVRCRYLGFFLFLYFSFSSFSLSSLSLYLLISLAVVDQCLAFTLLIYLFSFGWFLNVFALSQLTGLFLKLQYFLLPTCCVLFSLSCFVGLSLSGPLPIVFTIVFSY